jgi:hypothetical protein
MPNHEMLPLRPEVVAIGAGAYRATGRLPMGGNWVMRIANDGESHEFPFVLREF